MIKLLLMDVDGTLTDGRLYLGNNGEEYKAFSIKDGLAIHEILPKHNIIPIIITGKRSAIVERRSKELNIEEVYQGTTDKLEVLKKIVDSHSVSISEIAYIGDDLNDYDCIKYVSENGGVVGCPNDSAEEVKVGFVSSFNGGCGAVREFIEYIVK